VSGVGKVRLMEGNEACAEGALAAGLKFFAGYPITPSSEIAELLAWRLPQIGGKFIQMEDEIASMAAVIGASLAGSKAMTATSGPGFSLLQENIGFAIMAEIPCVVVDVQRMGPSTGSPTKPAQGDVMQARWGTHGDHPVIALAPSSVEETYRLTIDAFNLAEEYRTCIFIMLDELVAHMRERVELLPPDKIKIINRVKPKVPPEEYNPYSAPPAGVPQMANFGEGYRYHVTGLIHDKTGFPTEDPKEIEFLITRLTNKIIHNAGDIVHWEEKFMEDAIFAVFAYGSTARSALHAVKMARQEGIKVGFIRPITLWPFPTKMIDRAVQSVNRIIVAEMNLGQMYHEVKKVSQGRAEVEILSRVDGELFTPQEILYRIKETSG